MRKPRTTPFWPAAVLAGTLATGCTPGNTPAPQPDPLQAQNLQRFTLTGKAVPPKNASVSEYACTEDTQFSGAPILVYAADGNTILAKGTLGSGQWVKVTTLPNGMHAAPPLHYDRCEFTISVPEVPAGGDIFQVSIAGQQKIPLSRTEAQDPKLEITLTLN
ncbi:hypothetical protein [Streptomyces sp. CS014]|uniref:hypothetical protein n=1 Tax=Streptomyces sp. CS014 TaxID=2162707 RepID=UPI000D5236B9|nr:hypothetical protein [Streptomyces sp. CS014]PVD04465.1 hypothetical protein DBP12_03300 [Streptomyces sp. CS014]